MGLNIWLIFTSVLLVSAEARRYDQGPQNFYDVSHADSANYRQYENKEAILFLTPEQIRALEISGVVVQSADSDNQEEDSELLAEPQKNEEQEETEENQEAEDAEEEEETQQEQENSEEDEDQGIDFENILRLLNEEQVEEEETEEEQAQNQPQLEEENTEKPRSFSPRLTLRQQELKYLSPAAAKKEQLKTYSYISYLPNEQKQKLNVQVLQNENEASIAKEFNKKQEADALSQEKKTYKLLSYEVEETSAPGQEQSEAEGDVQTIRKNQLKEELKSILRKFKASSKYNNQKHAVDVENLRNLEKQKTLTEAVEIGKTPVLFKTNKRIRLNKNKNIKASPDVASKQPKPQHPRSQKNAKIPKSIAVPVINIERSEVQRPIAVPVETGKTVSVENVYVQTKANKPYIVPRKVAQSKKQSPVEASKNKPDRITILRHHWDI